MLFWIKFSFKMQFLWLVQRNELFIRISVFLSRKIKDIQGYTVNALPEGKTFLVVKSDDEILPFQIAYLL